MGDFGLDAAPTGSGVKSIPQDAAPTGWGVCKVNVAQTPQHATTRPAGHVSTVTALKLEKGLPSGPIHAASPTDHPDVERSTADRSRKTIVEFRPSVESAAVFPGAAAAGQNCPAASSSRCKSKSAELRDISIEFQIKDLEAATENFDETRRLGAGAFGAVYRAEMRDGSQAAVKLIDLEKLGSAASGFEEEVAILSKFRHPNLILLMGWARTDTCRFLVYEFLPGGDVCVRLQKCKTPGGKAFPWQDRLSASLDAATGLAYLHNAKPHAYHRDIKSANILLDASGTGAKMADFGLSCIANVQRSSSFVSSFTSRQSQGPPRSDGTFVAPCGTPGYTCPNYLRSGRITEASEVYSFGIVFLELLLNAFPSVISQDGGLKYPIYEIVRFGEPGARERAMAHADATGSWPSSIAEEVAALALKCIDLSNADRPTFNDVCRTIRTIQSMDTQDAQLSRIRNSLSAGKSFFKSIFKLSDELDDVSWAAPAQPEQAQPEPAQQVPAQPGPAQPMPEQPAAAQPRPVQPLQRVPPCPPGELVLDAVYTCTFNHGIPTNFRVLRLQPLVQVDGRCVVQIGRAQPVQGQWFNDLLISADLVEKTVSGLHAEIVWHGIGGGGAINPTVQHIGDLPMCLNNEHLTRGQLAPLKEGSHLQFIEWQGSMKGTAKLVLSIGFSNPEMTDGRHPVARFEVEAYGQLPPRMMEATCADRCADKIADRCTLQ